MLINDQEYFERKYPGADAFLTAAKLRQECFTLAMCKRNFSLTPWEESRLAELSQAPACQEPWFLALLAMNNASLE